jgi:sugar phosphate isomerase/epimerase
MRISCSTRWGECEQTFSLIRDAGFTAVDLVVLSVPAAIGEIVNTLKRFGLTPSGLTVDNGSPQAWPAAIRAAAILGMESVTLTGGGRKQQRIDVLAETLRPVLAAANKAGIAVELVNRRGSCLEQPSDFHELHVRLGALQTGVVIDAVEYHRSSVNPVDAIAQLGDRMSRLVVGDAIADRRAPLGEGEINIASVIERSRRVGHPGWLVLDPCVRGMDTASVDLAAERERLEAILGTER